jgi:hypothetical protein
VVGIERGDIAIEAVQFFDILAVAAVFFLKRGGKPS